MKYIWRFEDEGSDWSNPLGSEEECVRHALADKLLENLDFESILVAEVKLTQLPQINIWERR